MTSIISAVLMGVMMVATVAATWQQSNPSFSAALSRFHSRQSSGSTSLMNLSYGHEVLGASHEVLGDRVLAVPLRLDYSHRSGAATQDERRIILCLYWPAIADLYPDFPFDKVCQ